MTRDDIFRMAREASGGTTWWPLNNDTLERFAALVAAAERKACLSEIKEAKADIWDGLDSVIKETAGNVCDNLIIRISARGQA